MIANNYKSMILEKKVKLFDIFFTIGTYNELVDIIIDKAKAKHSSYVCFANAHMVVEGYRNKEFLRTLCRADIVTTDGMPIVWAHKWISKIHNAERVAGMDIINSILSYSNNNSLSIFFYGSTEENLMHLKEECCINYPNIIINTYSPPFRQLLEEEKKEIISMINSFDPTFVFVSLGCPKQEIWMDSMKGSINSLMLGVGNAFLTSAGIEKRAPKWMQKYGLEWLFRFIHEPRRLWKRYLFTNSFFIYLALKYKILSWRIKL